jgi:hypothetical protein
MESLYDRLDTERWLIVAPRLVAADVWPRCFKHFRQFAGLSWRHVGAKDFNLKAETKVVELDDGEIVNRKVGLTFGGREDKAEVKRALKGMPETVHIVSWDFLPWLVRAWGANWPYDGMILDESLFAQSSTSERHKAVFQVAHRLKRVNRIIELSGMPRPNGVEQLHGQMRLLDGGRRLGDSKTEFYERFCVPGKRGPNGAVWKWNLAPGAADLITTLVGELCVSLKSEDYLQLPPLLVNPVRVTLPPAARELYDTLERDLVAQIGDAEILAPSQGVAVGKLRQIANGAVYDGSKKVRVVHDAKLLRLHEIRESVDGPILLAYNFQHDWERIKSRFKGAVHVNDPGALDRFRRGEVSLLCMHPENAEGLDGLQQVSSTAVWYGATYNARHWGQFNKRLHRDGSTADRVTLHQILAEDTIEEYVAGKVLPDKVEEQEVLLDAIKLRAPGLARVSMPAHG